MPSSTDPDVVWVDVLPSLDRMVPALRSGLARIAPQAGAEAGRAYSDGFTRSAVSGVEAASAKLAAARNKEADAAGKLRVAEAKLQELRDSGRARASQLAAAEENLGRAQRGVADSMAGAERAARGLASAQQQTERSAQQAERGSNGLLASLKGMAGLVVGGGIVAGLKSLYEQGAESARIGRLTEQVITSTGGAAKITADQVGDLATAISNKTGVDDEAIQSGENLLLTFTSIRNEAGKGNDIFNQATSIITDMSVALGQDMSSSAIQVGKALNDPIKGVTALQRVGVSFTESQKDQIKVLVESGNTMGAQKLILGELSKEFGGAAQAAATPWDKLQVNLGNLAEQLGGYIIPVVDEFATFLLDKVIPGAQGAASWVGDHLGPAFQIAGDLISGTADALGAALHWFSDLPGPVQLGAAALVLLVVAAGPIEALMGRAALAVGSIGARAIVAAGEVGIAAAAMNGLKGIGSGLLASFGGPWGLAITGVTIGLGYLVQWLTRSDSATQSVTQATQEYASALEQSKGVIDDNVRAAAAKSAQDAKILDVAQRLGIPLSQVTDAITTQGSALDATRAQLQAYIDAHTYLQAHGKFSPPTKELDDEGKSAQNALDAIDRLSGTTTVNQQKQQQLAAATAVTATTMGGSAKQAAKDLTTELQATQKAAGDAKTQTDLLKLSLDILTGAHVSMIQVESAFYASIAAADGALKGLNGSVLDGTGDLNTQSEAGRKTADVLRGVRDSGNELISTMIQQGATAEQANAKDAQLRASFYQTALQMTGSKDAAARLTDQIYGIPAERRTQIDADTSQATAAIQDVQTRIENLHGKEVLVSVKANGSVQAILGSSSVMAGRLGIATGYSEGGYTGPGGKYTPAGFVHAGEIVWSQDDIAAHGGVGQVEAMRKMRGYADGGIVVNFDDQALAATVDAVKKALLVTVPTGGVPTNPMGNVQLGLQLASARGWGSMAEWSALYNLWQRESGWRNTAQNPTSTAYGIPQFLDGTWASVGARKTSDAGGQIRAGLDYIAQRFNDPIGAWAHETRFGWYEKGTDYVPNTGPAILHEGEAVLTRSDNAALRALVAAPPVDSYTARLATTTSGRAAGESSALIGEYHSHFHGDHDEYRAFDELEHRLRVAEMGGRYARTTSL